MERTATLDSRPVRPSAAAPDYRAFFEARGRMSYWPTAQIGYRIGALLALAAQRLGLRPSLLTWASLLTTCAAAGTVHFRDPGLVAFLLLLGGLLLGYAFDCADGPLARVTGRCSLAGALLDKCADLACAILVPLLLLFATDPSPHLAVVALAVAPRPLLGLLVWLKEAHVHGDDRLRTDRRPRDRRWKMRRALGGLSDEILYRIGLALSWATGGLAAFMAVYGAFILILATGYLRATIRDEQL